MQIAGDHFAHSRLFHDAKFTKPGFFSGFVLVESDDEAAGCDPDAMAQVMDDEGWRLIMDARLTSRLSAHRRSLRLDREGIVTYLDFGGWYLEFLSELPEQHLWSFSGLNNLLLRFAIGLALMEEKADGEILDARFLRSAGELLKAHAPRQAALLDTLLPKAETTGHLDARIERLVARLAARGLMTKRDLARTINGQDYGVIDTLLAEALRQGLILQRGNQFVATGVNVNASTGEKVLDFSRGVAA